ncbi:MAG: DUF192 domain-containing protein [Acidobacteria bacterium]|nr:DUF192 domain-containing protein [Acidobacteriota bacterium]
MRIQTFLAGAVFLLLAGCAKEEQAATMEDLTTREVKFPNGTKIRAEVLYKPFDMARGMMFRDSLAADRGMLFINKTAGVHKSWMYNLRIPLDIIYIDQNLHIAEIVANAPPCKAEKASQCPSYGTARSQFMLEVNAGFAAKHNLKIGDRLDF